MRKSLFIGMMVAGIMMLGSCGGGSKPQQSMVYEEDSTDIESLWTCYGDEYVRGAYR